MSDGPAFAVKQVGRIKVFGSKNLCSNHPMRCPIQECSAALWSHELPLHFDQDHAAFPAERRTNQLSAYTMSAAEKNGVAEPLPLWQEAHEDWQRDASARAQPAARPQ